MGEPTVIQQQRTATKPSIAGLPMTDASDAWMDDDFGTIDSESETELDESQKIENGRSLCKEEAKTYQQNQEKVNNSNTPTVIGLPMTEASDAWMDDDVLQIESESENESDKTSINADEKEHQLHKTRTNQIGLPMNDASDAWMKEIQKLVGYVDVQPLVTDMTSNLGSLHCVMEDAQQCLEHRLKNLQVRCT